MKRKIVKFLWMVFLVLMSKIGFCAGGIVHDPSNYARAFEILKTAKSHIEETRRVQEEIAGTRRLIGNFKEEAQIMKNELLNWRTYYDKIDLLDPNSFSLMNWLGLGRMLPNTNTGEAFNLIDDKLFRTHVKDVKKEDYPHVINQLHYEREKVARNAIVTGIVVAEKSKTNLGESKKKMIAATDKAIGASDLMTIMKAQNELLSVIAGELLQQRELQAQMLQFMTAYASQQYGASRNEPPTKSPFKSSF